MLLGILQFRWISRVTVAEGSRLKQSLRSEGYRVSSRRDGKSGEKEAGSGRYDLIIVDVMLPERDGFQICKNLRDSGVTTPILMLTARSTALDTVTGLRAGADDYLRKPFDMQELLAQVMARSDAGARMRKTPGRSRKSCTSDGSL